MTVAQTIIDQLGGNKFIAMTGSKNFLTIAETSALTGAPVEYVTERMVELLKDKAQKEQGGNDA